MDLPIALEHLAYDLRSVQQGAGPTPEELAAAPLLLNGRLVSEPAFALEGMVLDHPLLGTRRIRTSMIYLLDEERRWVRTLSRYYRLASTS